MTNQYKLGRCKMSRDRKEGIYNVRNKDVPSLCTFKIYYKMFKDAVHEKYLIPYQIIQIIYIPYNTLNFNSEQCS